MEGCAEHSTLLSHECSPVFTASAAIRSAWSKTSKPAIDAPPLAAAAGVRGVTDFSILAALFELPNPVAFFVGFMFWDIGAGPSASARNALASAEYRKGILLP